MRIISDKFSDKMASLNSQFAIIVSDEIIMQNDAVRVSQNAKKAMKFGLMQRIQ